MNRRQFITGGGALALAGVGAAAFSFARTGSMADYAAAVAATRAGLSERPQFADFVRFATLAANGHNTQPWRFRLGEDHITILPDFARRTPVVDPDDHHLFASLGCTAENLALAAAARGRRGELRFDPTGNGSAVFEPGAGPAERSVLFEAIPKRQSTRADYDGRSIATADLETLAAAARVPGVDLILLTDRQQIERVRDLVVAGNSAQMADPAFMRELKHWLRFAPSQALETGDGLFSAASGNPTAPAWLGGLMFDLLFRAATENDKHARQLHSSAGIAIFVSERDDKEHWMRAGRACQRFALQATALGLKHAFINQPFEVAALRLQLASLVGMPRRRPDIVMRFGYGPALPFSPRRPVEAVLAPADA
ncbi:Acg family FMN-binding oxidoreductase [Bradyrhizobium quebecense]|uniref:Nitroreductase family protein n=2 Tax=Bradyrhizobium quebecense TaxID=2748629 RepID=A0ACD3VME8_9BRAD|nr:nitroreductase family protein [Bradyrhizobium quebecense]UGY07307.1 nitroreductase family protein [Bradyrhizobium quebecense]